MSKTLEYYFNPKKKGEEYFESFAYAPSDKKEASLGNLYMVAHLRNQSLERKEAVQKLAERIKERYYEDSDKRREDAFRAALKEADGYLKVVARKNPNILEHLSFTVFSLSFDLDLSFSKIGDLKMFLVRGGQAFDIGKDLDINYSTPNIFPNVVGGKLEEEDQMVIFSKPFFEKIGEKKIFENFQYIKKASDLKKLLKDKRKELRRFPGLLFYIFAKRKKATVLLNIPSPSIPSLNIYERIYPESPVFREKLKQSLIAIFILILILLIGYAFF